MMLEGGIYSKEERTAYRDLSSDNECETHDQHTVDFAAVSPAFLILTLGMLASLIALFIERTTFNI